MATLRLALLLAAACAARAGRRRPLPPDAASLAEFSPHRLAGVMALASPLAAEAFAPRAPPSAARGAELRAAEAVAAAPPRPRPVAWLRRQLARRAPQHLGADVAPWTPRLRDIRVEDSGDLHRDYAARVEGSGMPVSLKVIDVSDPQLQQELARELDLTRRFGGGDLAALYAVSYQDDAARCPTAAVLMEKLDGSLRTQVLGERVEMLRREVKMLLLGEVLRGLAKLADQGYVHRNLNPENIAVAGECDLVLHTCHVKLAGLGLACPADVADPDVVRQATRNGIYAAPELWSDEAALRTADLSKVDVWSAGVVAYELFVGSPPVVRKGGRAPFEIDLAGDSGFKELKQSEPAVAHVIERMLSTSPRQRPSARDALDMVVDLLRKRGIFELPQQETRSLPAGFLVEPRRAALGPARRIPFRVGLQGSA